MTSKKQPSFKKKTSLKSQQNLRILGGLFIFSKILLVLAWALFIAAVMTKPLPVPDQLTGEFTWYDKIVHVVMFGGLCFSWLLVWRDYKKISFYGASCLSFALSLIWAYGLEEVQRSIPGRMTDVFDLLFGLLGALLAILLYYLYLYKAKSKLLLHICCATCGAYVSQLLSQDFRVVLYYYNPNIFPKAEFTKRLAEVQKISKHYHLPLIVGRYDHDRWRKAVKGHEADPEKGQRCCLCYQLRLKQAFAEAKKRKLPWVATTLSVSPHKLAEVINQQGQELAQKNKLNFLERDFKKQDGFKRSMELSKKFEFYRQDYCGCEFSRRDRLAKKP